MLSRPGTSARAMKPTTRPNTIQPMMVKSIASPLSLYVRQRP
jgi:hypothetical protein